MEDVQKYIQRPLPERQSHLDINAVCSEIGGSSSIEFKGLLAYFLGTTIPTKGEGFKIHLCHACGNGKCSRVTHLYWGTPSENYKDGVRHGTQQSPYVRTLHKYGEEGLKHIAAKAGKAAAEANRKRKLPKEHWEQYRPAFESIEKTRGWKSHLANELGMSHTNINRIAKRLGI